ncbi:hypothetical protein BRADI_4g04645v3 [Brachypodium distachyon]|uniref:Uncharacterized protein n=1 Tax=Brachypodium distachyon TaxID=15368 RepID=A0A2K2CKE7_BRADI|nr:hypothetical protein BRADI_4g04645v3 [Brachypodium distachyon]
MMALSETSLHFTILIYFSAIGFCKNKIILSCNFLTATGALRCSWGRVMNLRITTFSVFLTGKLIVIGRPGTAAASDGRRDRATMAFFLLHLLSFPPTSLSLF